VTIHTTPVYGLAYCDTDTPLVDLAAVSQTFATTTEAALVRGGIAPPAAQDLATLSGRVTALETGRPIAFLRQTTAQTGLVGWTAILFQTEDIDTHNAHSTTTNTSRFTVPAGQGGIYAVEGVVDCASTATSVQLVARLHKNGTFLPAGKGGSAVTNTAAGGDALVSTDRHLITLAAGDYIELVGNGGTSWSTIAPVDGGSWLAVERIR
jgi:hypothetical protein